LFGQKASTVKLGAAWAVWKTGRDIYRASADIATAPTAADQRGEKRHR
jgi:hypothetical protein